VEITDLLESLGKGHHVARYPLIWNSLVSYEKINPAIVVVQSDVDQLEQASSALKRPG